MVALIVDLNRGFRGLNRVVVDLEGRVGGPPIVWIGADRAARSRVRGELVLSRSQRILAHPVAGLVLDGNAVRVRVGLDDLRINGRANRGREGGEDVGVRRSEVSVPQVQGNREFVDYLERLVRVLHDRDLGRRQRVELPGVQVGRQVLRCVVLLVRGRIVVDSRIPEILAQDELRRQVHQEASVETKPHHIGIEGVPIREVDSMAEIERVRQIVVRRRPALRKDRHEVRVTGPLVHHEFLVHLLDDGPPRCREGHRRVQGVRVFRLIEDQRIRGRQRTAFGSCHHVKDHDAGDDDHDREDDCEEPRPRVPAAHLGCGHRLRGDAVRGTRRGCHLVSSGRVQRPSRL